MLSRQTSLSNGSPQVKDKPSGHLDLDLMLGKTTSYPLVPVQALKQAQGYEWYSNRLRRKFEENVACGMNSAMERWPLQVEERVTTALQAFDDDRIKRVTNTLKEVYYSGGPLGRVNSLDPPIRLKGKDFVWHGELVGNMREFTRDDQVVPLKVHKRIVHLRNAGIRFNEYVMFVPGESYDPSKKELARNELSKMGKELVLAAKATGRAVKGTARVVASGTKTAALVAGRTARNFAGVLSALPAAVAIPISIAAVPDPILCGVIKMANPKTGGYLLINLGKWV